MTQHRFPLPRSFLPGVTMLRSTLALLLLLGLVAPVAPVVAGEVAPEEICPDPSPHVVVHVPVDEMEVLLEADRRGIVLRHEEYRRLLDAAKAQANERGLEPPAPGVLVSARGRLDLTAWDAARLEVVYDVVVLAEGASIVAFPWRGLALDRVEVEGEGRYEELDGAGRLRFEGAGSRRVKITAYATPHRKGERRLIDLHVPPASAFALSVDVPPAARGVLQGEGATVEVHSGPDAVLAVDARPARHGRLRAVWEPATRAVEGPPVLDVETRAVHGLEDGLVRSRILVHVDVLRTPTSTLDLVVPANLGLKAATGKGVAGTRRSEDRTRLRVDLDGERRGRITLALDGETPYQPQDDLVLPGVNVENAVRQHGTVALRFAPEVEVHDIRVQGGRRLPSARRKGAAPLLQYALASADGEVRVDLATGDVRLEASSTYYLNLTEPAKTMLAAVTYQVTQGTAFRLEPRFPNRYALRKLQVNGRTSGFRYDQRDDGAIEVRLERGIPEGGSVQLVAMMEEAEVDWVPEGGSVELTFDVPSAGADREEGYIGIGADASFAVLDANATGLVAVGAAELTSRGVTPAGLVYGYRRDGDAPSVTLEVRRRIARLGASVVTHALPSPRRLRVENVIVHRIERAGVRRLEIDVPTWARDVARIDAVDLVAATRMDPQPAGVPAGYDRWEVQLARRVLGRHATVATYWQDQDVDDWSVDAALPIAVRLPLERSDRSVVVARASGLKVDLEGSAATQDLSELPPEVPVNPLRVREVVRLEPDANGPGIRVRKHDGAPVLDAIAPLVVLETAADAEGVLRTRARVEIVNVGLQFLRVALPPGSELIGAVVDDKSVKPLADPEGVLRIPVPPARDHDGRTTAVLTYETNLGRAIHGDVEIPAPEFPGLEVLKTVHRVAFDERYEIRDVQGDFGEAETREPTARLPWIEQIRHLFRREVAGAEAREAAYGADPGGSELHLSAQPPGAYSADTSAPAGGWRQYEAEVRQSVGPDRVIVVGRDEQYARQLVQSRENIDLQQHAEEATKLQAEISRLQQLGSDVRRKRAGVVQPNPQVAPTPPQVRYVPVPARYETLPDGRKVCVAPATMREVLPQPPAAPPADGPGQAGWDAWDPGAEDPAEQPQMDMPTSPSNAGLPAPSGAPVPVTAPGAIVAAPPVRGLPPADPWGPQADPATGGPPRLPPAAGGEGPSTTATPTPTPRLRRKGLLSLDVPVLLSPNVVEAQRLGGGGTMTVALTSKATGASRYWFGVLLAFALGLTLAVRGRWWAWLVPLCGIGLAVLVRLVFGPAGWTAAVALTDATTALLGVLLVRWIVRGLFFRSPRAAATAVLVLVSLLVATTARADEASEAEDVSAPRTVYMPYDPEDPAVPRAHDRVFLPLDVYLELRRLAHPDEDPDVLARGRVVTRLGASHTLRVGPLPGVDKDEARGTMHLAFAKRGDGLAVVPLELGGLAVVKARLDGEPIPLLLRDGKQHVPLEAAGDHELRIDFRVPVMRDATGRRIVLDIPPFAGARMELEVGQLEGEVRVPGAGRVGLPQGDGKPATTVPVLLGSLSRVEILLEDPQGRDPEVTLRTRAESRVVHSVRDGGTESRARVTLVVLQGKARHVDLALPDDVAVLHARGKAVSRWERSEGRLRLVFAGPQEGSVTCEVAIARKAATPSREETLPTLAVLDTTGESGRVVLNADPFLRVEPTITQGLGRLGMPRDKAARGPDQAGRVAGAWEFSTRPTSFGVRVEEARKGVKVESTVAVSFGDDTVHSRFDAKVSVESRVPVGGLVFDLPGGDEVRSVRSPGLETWWTEGEGDVRSLHLRYRDLHRGTLEIRLRLARRLGGKRDAVTVPRWRLRGAQRDSGRLVLFALPDVDPDPGRLPGLKSGRLSDAALPETPVRNATARRSFTWEEPLAASLPVTLRTPSLEVEAVVVSSLHPGDEAHRLEHLALFDVRRGFTDRFDLFVPDGGMAALDVVRTRDLREVRRRTVTRRGTDGSPVEGTLYEIRLQAPRRGIVEVTVSQMQRPEAPVRVIRPEQVGGNGQAGRDLETVRWFGLVRTFLDGEVEVGHVGTSPDPVAWEDLPFLPSGLERHDLFQAVSARVPYVLDVSARRQRMAAQADAVVRAAQADVVLGRDGQARVRVRYRLFNRQRQFLRIRLPDEALLFGVKVAGQPVKPLEGSEGDFLLPIPKVQLGGAGYEVAVLYRAPAGSAFPARDLNVALPEVLDVEVDRTVVRLYVPAGYDVKIDSEMLETDAQDVAADLAEAAVREAKDLIDVAKGGNLEQRQRAAANLGVLVQEMNDLNKRAGNKRADLEREAQQVEQDFQDQYKAIVQDLETAGREADGQQLDVFASNAAPILETAPTFQAAQQQGAQSGGGGGGSNNDAGPGQWRFNPSRSSGEGEKEEISQLKQRLGKSLEERAAQEVQDFDIEIAQQSEVVVDEVWKNFGVLNGILEQSQRRNRQLGVVQDPTAGQSFFALVPEPSAQGTSADSGIYFNDGVDGDFRGQTESLFDQGLTSYAGRLNDDVSGFGFTSFGLDALADQNGNGFFTDRIPSMHEGSTRGRARSGLMGVDVPLPRQAQVFLYRSMRAGSPMHVSVTEQETSSRVRWALFLGVLLVAAGAFVAVRRRLGRSREAAA